MGSSTQRYTQSVRVGTTSSRDDRKGCRGTGAEAQAGPDRGRVRPDHRGRRDGRSRCIVPQQLHALIGMMGLRPES